MLHAAEDDSYCLVPSSDVICEPSVKIGEEVKFAYGSRRKPIDGIVKAMGGKHFTQFCHLSRQQVGITELASSSSGLLIPS